MLKIFKNGIIKLYPGDCLNFMPSMPDKSVNAVITDPPYGIDFKYSAHDDSPNDYEALMKSVIRQTERINKGMTFFWQAMNNADKWHCWFPPGYRIFAACKGFVQYRPTPIQYSFDPVIFWGNFNGEPSVYKKDFHVQSKAPFGFKREKIEHPCPRPLEQVAYIINISTNPNDIVFDPFMGSGTTAIACLQLGRRFVGCEIDPQYFSVAENRIKSALSRPSLFDGTIQLEESNQLDLAI
ncbi:MAG: site-specific DNA-methyltransferase [Calditrichia bacterium]|nr:site-specific DNA-methyltransferase [Calditrichia bacterium]